MLTITSPGTNLGPDQVSLVPPILCVFLLVLIYCNLSGYDPALSLSAANPCWLCVSYKLGKQTCWVSIQAVKSKGAQDKAKDKGPILPNADSQPAVPDHQCSTPGRSQFLPQTFPLWARGLATTPQRSLQRATSPCPPAPP